MGGCAKTAANFCGGLVIYIVGVINRLEREHPSLPLHGLRGGGGGPPERSEEKAGRRGRAAGTDG